MRCRSVPFCRSTNDVFTARLDDDCDSAAQLPRVQEMLEAKGLTRPQVEAVLGANARRVLRDGWR